MIERTFTVMMTTFTVGLVVLFVLLVVVALQTITGACPS